MVARAGHLESSSDEHIWNTASEEDDVHTALQGIEMFPLCGSIANAELNAKAYGQAAEVKDVEELFRHT